MTPERWDELKRELDPPPNLPLIGPGSRLGPYEVLAPLGRGGMGEVWRARDTALLRDVALKVLPAAVATEPSRRARFRREAQLLASLNHPSIGAIYGFEETGAAPALVLELVEGQTLALRLTRGPLAIDEALRLAVQIADALGAAHERGIVHRDLKPGNVMLRSDGTVKVLDFGLATVLRADPVQASDATASLTRAGLIAGTPAYMAPEQVRGETVDGRSDIWAFGCVLYEMLTGRPVFGAATATESLAKVLEGSIDLNALPVHTPPSVRRLVGRCLERRVRSRLQNISDARADLSDAQAGGASASHWQAAAPGWVRGLVTRGRVGVGVVVALLSVGGAWLVIMPRGRPPRALESVAVLPFTDHLGHDDLSYLVRGITESVSTGLIAAGVPRTIGPDSTSEYRQTTKRSGQIAGELNVDALVIGSAVRVAESYAVSVQLVEGGTERRIWVGRFERATTSELTITEDIVAALAHHMGRSTGAAPHATPRPISTEARIEFGRGREFWVQRRDFDKAAEHLTRAIELQPDYSLAWSALADAYAMGARAESRVIDPWPGDPIAAGIRAAEQAIALDPGLGEPHAALARFHLRRREWADAEGEARQAVLLSPQYSTARQWYGTILGRLGKCDEALKQVAIGASLDPRAPIVNEAIGRTHLMCGRPELAIAPLKDVLDLHPRFAPSYVALGLVYLELKRYGDAIDILQIGRDVSEACGVRAVLADALILGGKRAQGMELARTVLRQARSARGDLRCAVTASAALSDADTMFELLDQFEARNASVQDLLVDMHILRFRHDARYYDLVRRTGLLPYASAAPALGPAWAAKWQH
jgi:TolB-like protein/tetratricopeptide (TPR) repeat protein